VSGSQDRGNEARINVASWELFPNELRAALVQRYPAISWHVTLNRRAEVEGVTIGAHRGVETPIWVSTAAIESLTLDELLEAIHTEVERQLMIQRGT